MQRGQCGQQTTPIGRGLYAVRLTDGPWYVSNVSIIYEVFMPILSFLDVLQSFYSNFISFFGTNLLTQCRVSVVVFCLFFTSQEINIKRSPNTAKLFVDFLWTKRHPMGQRSTWGCPEGGTTHQGAPGPPGAPRWVVPTSVASRTPSLPYKFTNFRKPSRLT